MDSSQDIGVLTRDELPDLGEMYPGEREEAAQEMGLMGYQPGSRIGNLAKENRRLKGHVIFLGQIIRKLRAELASRTAS